MEVTQQQADEAVNNLSERMHIALPPHIKKAIKKVAEDQFTDMSHMVRTAIFTYMNAQHGERWNNLVEYYRQEELEKIKRRAESIEQV